MSSSFYFRQISTGIVYFLELDDIVIIPATLGVLNLVKMEQYISFKNNMNVDYTFITEASSTIMYEMSYSVYVKHVILSGDIDQIVSNLEVAWRQKLTSATTISITNVLQEEMVSPTR